ncbi:MAG TPA: FtsQ-type POTRA domain-containing protein [Treponemataceae bacterium]|nr:FtsQ-type POTRA domain-containing protein [Treponemataceae bacterium]
MSESAFIDTFSAHAVSSSQEKEWKPVLLKILSGFLLLFVLAECAFYFVFIPMTARIHVSVHGSIGTGSDEIRSIAGITGQERWITFDTASAAATLAANPLFESVVVEKKFPDKIIVTVIPRNPVAVAFGTVNGRTVPLEIDRSGVVFRIGHCDVDTRLPLITGLSFDQPVAGMRLHSRLKPLLKDLAEIERNNPTLISSISEIKVEEKTYGGYDLVVYPVHTPVRVRTDKALNQDRLQYMMLVLDVVQDLALDIDEIDIRAGTVAYRLKGEQL